MMNSLACCEILPSCTVKKSRFPGPARSRSHHPRAPPAPTIMGRASQPSFDSSHARVVDGVALAIRVPFIRGDPSRILRGSQCLAGRFLQVIRKERAIAHGELSEGCEVGLGARKPMVAVHKHHVAQGRRAASILTLALLDKSRKRFARVAAVDVEAPAKVEGDHLKHARARYSQALPEQLVGLWRAQCHGLMQNLSL